MSHTCTPISLKLRETIMRDTEESIMYHWVPNGVKRKVSFSPLKKINKQKTGYTENKVKSKKKELPWKENKTIAYMN